MSRDGATHKFAVHTSCKRAPLSFRECDVLQSISAGRQYFVAVFPIHWGCVRLMNARPVVDLSALALSTLSGSKERKWCRTRPSCTVQVGKCQKTHNFLRSFLEPRIQEGRELRKILNRSHYTKNSSGFFVLS